MLNLQLDWIRRYRMPADAEGDDEAGGEPVDEDSEDDGANTEPEESSEADEVEEESTLAALAREGGFVVGDDEDDLAVAQRLMERSRSADDLQRKYEELQRQFETLRYQAAYQPQQQVQAQPTAPTTAEFQYPDHLAMFREPPPYDPEWLRLVKHDDEGNLVAISGADPTLPAKITERQRWERNAINTFLGDPRGFVNSILQNDPSYQQAIDHAVESRLGAYQQQQEMLEIQRQLAPKFFSHDEKGTPVLQNGQPVVSEWGRHYTTRAQELIAEAERNGVQFPLHMHNRIASEYADAQTAAKQATTNPDETKSKKRLAKLKAAAGKQSETRRRAGGSPKERRSSRSEIDLRREMTEAFEAAGFQPSSRVT